MLNTFRKSCFIKLSINNKGLNLNYEEIHKPTLNCLNRHKRCFGTATASVQPSLNKTYDAVIIGGGHNGLVAAAYLAKAGKSVCVLERRHVVGGAAVTEEIIPDFKFSRASYVLGLLRPVVKNELNLKKYGLKVYDREPNSYTPLLDKFWKDGKGRSLILGSDQAYNLQQISQFSVKDAHNFEKYESFLEKCAKVLVPLMDYHSVDMKAFLNASLTGKIQYIHSMKPVINSIRKLGMDFGQFIEVLTAPATKILDQWFESEPLRATLATDSVIGSMISPSSPTSGYVLLHHIMASIEGSWGYPEGGMGGVTQAMCRAATEAGAHVFVNQPVKGVLLGDNKEVIGVETEGGVTINTSLVLSNATPHITKSLLPKYSLPTDYEKSLDAYDYTSPVCKINVALKSLPNFLANPNARENSVMPHHRTTIHLNCEDIDLLEEAYLQCSGGDIPDNPMIEMTIPSSCDPTLAPPGCHVALFFTQYVPYTLKGGQPWDEQAKSQYATKIFNIVDSYAPGFSNSIVGYEVLPPPDLESIFGLTGGNIFHGAMTLDQLYMNRPSAQQASPSTPITGLLLCGSGAHPGGGVMGSAGRLAALTALKQI